MAQFNISPCTAEDLPAIAAISLDAFTSNPRTMSYWMLRDAKREELLPWRLSRVAHDFHNDANARYYKLVDMESGNIVAHIVWETPTQEVSSEEEEENRRIEQEFKTNEVVPAGVNKAMQEQFRADTKSMRAKYVDKTKDYVLNVIATLPEYQGKGYGSALLEHGLKEVDASGAKAFLEATPQGHPIYEKFGWRDVDEIVFDLEKYGGVSVQTTTCMQRPAREHE